MDTDRLQMFVTLAETLNFHRASERCHISPSTLSRNIQQLEQALNANLFERNNKRVVLTNHGQLFLTHAREILKQWETVYQTMQAGATELTGAISLYCSVTASYSFLYELLTQFRQNHPKIEIKLHTGDPALAIERIMSGVEDIAIAARPETLPQALSFKTFTDTPLIFIAPKQDKFFRDLTVRQPKSFWPQLPLIISEKGLARDRINAWFRKKNIIPTIYAQVAGNEAIVSMVSLGFGIGLVPKIVVDNSPLKNSVKPFLQQPDLKPYEVGICVLKRRLKSPLVEAFWSQIPDVKKSTPR